MGQCLFKKVWNEAESRIRGHSVTPKRTFSGCGLDNFMGSEGGTPPKVAGGGGRAIEIYQYMPELQSSRCLYYIYIFIKTVLLVLVIALKLASVGLWL